MVIDGPYIIMFNIAQSKDKKVNHFSELAHCKTKDGISNAV